VASSVRSMSIASMCICKGKKINRPKPDNAARYDKDQCKGWQLQEAGSSMWREHSFDVDN
jgi:hypothetical protein